MQTDLTSSKTAVEVWKDRSKVNYLPSSELCKHITFHVFEQYESFFNYGCALYQDENLLDCIRRFILNQTTTLSSNNKIEYCITQAHATVPLDTKDELQQRP